MRLRRGAGSRGCTRLRPARAGGRRRAQRRCPPARSWRALAESWLVPLVGFAADEGASGGDPVVVEGGDGLPYPRLVQLRLRHFDLGQGEAIVGGESQPVVDVVDG